uniref:PPIase cyclophilin-type domain-containing protein n=1 Tax=Electrophorus electricus TaxID=8005 RepID=A0AAY5F644_ELEEL
TCLCKLMNAPCLSLLQKLEAKSLIKLNFSKNNEGKRLHRLCASPHPYHDVKVIICVCVAQAVEQLNIKTKNYKDLLTDEPFTRQDIITLQDPTHLDKFNVSDFFHVKNNMKVLDPDEEKAKQDPAYHLKSTNLETRETLAELYKEYKGDELLASTMKEPEAKKTDKLNAAHYSTGRVSASFTSTAMAPATTHEADAIAEDAVRYQYVKKKGYVRLHTNKGDLNLELHCDKVPKAGENFIKLCKKAYYDGTVFHRSIRNFMIQGGDPTGTGTGGESFWGKPFADEFKPNLSHTGRGVLSMANSGPNTNKSQFFITFRSCTYLDRKHTVFGRVVGGFGTLTAMENVESDPKTDRPKVRAPALLHCDTSPCPREEPQRAGKRGWVLKACLVDTLARYPTLAYRLIGGCMGVRVTMRLAEQVSESPSEWLRCSLSC